MYLYRVCSREEYDIIERDKSFQNVGTRGEFFLLLNKDQDLSSHNYNFNNKYLHFYEDRDNIFFRGLEKGKIIYVLDIDDKRLEGKEGFGNYFDYSKMHTENILEYALEVDSLSYNDICLVQEITEDISLSEVLYDDTNSKIITIYDKDKPYQKRKDPKF